LEGAITLSKAVDEKNILSQQVLLHRVLYALCLVDQSKQK